VRERISQLWFEADEVIRSHQESHSLCLLITVHNTTYHQQSWNKAVGDAEVLNSEKGGSHVIESKQRKNWCVPGDDFRAFLGEFVSNVQQFDCPQELIL
jgi:hypothetical protein